MPAIGGILELRLTDMENDAFGLLVARDSIRSFEFSVVGIFSLLSLRGLVDCLAESPISGPRSIDRMS